MARHKNTVWNLSEKPSRAQDGGEAYSYNTIQTAVLMDIRDELQILNRVLRCPDFLRIPRHLEVIEQNTKKRKRRRNGHS